VLTSLIYLAWQYIEESRQQDKVGSGRLQPWVIPAAIVLVVLVLAGVGFGFRHKAEAVAAKADPQSLVARLKSISWNDPNLQERLVMTDDAWKIMVSSPANALLGAGGGGWNAMYHMFQPYPYFSTETHNDFMQTGVEVGFPGLLDFLLIWGFMIAAAWQVYRFARSGGLKAEPGQAGGALPATTWVILCSALALGISSATDFNLSLGAVAILLWGLFGLIRGLDRLYGPVTAAKAAAAEAAAAAQNRRERNYHKKNEQTTTWRVPNTVKGIIAGALALTVFFVALDLTLGLQYAEAGDLAAKGNNLQTAISDYEQAVQHDATNATFRSTLAQYYMDQAQSDEQTQGNQTAQNAASNDASTDLSKAQATMSVAIRDSRGDSSLRMVYAQVLFQSAGGIDTGLQQLDQAVTLLPLQSSPYEGLAEAYFQAGQYYLEMATQQGSSSQDAAQYKQQGLSDLAQALGVPASIQSRLAGVSKKMLQLSTARGFTMLSVTPLIDQNAGMAGVLLGKYQQVDSLLQASMSDSSLKAKSMLWEGVSLQQQGEAGPGQQLINQAEKSDSSLAQQLPQIKELLAK
jgi:hypothetical protein